MVARYVANPIKLGNHTVKVYASPKVGHALNAVTKDMTFYQGVKLLQLLEAVYEQGKKDGARNAFDTLQEKVLEAEKLVPHKNPGKPRKKTP